MMKHWVIALLFMLLLSLFRVPSVLAGDPFTAGVQESRPASPLLIKITVWQHRLKQEMTNLIRTVRTGQNIKPLLLLMAVAFSYGVIHAAGPGHGKAIAISYVLSHPLSIPGGIAFGVLLSFFHGFSGAVCVLGLNYIIQRRVSDTLGAVTTVTQVVSFSLIALLGLGVLIHNGLKLRKGSAPPPETGQGTSSSPKRLLPWAFVLGLAPCPAVVMVLLFCLSMGALPLGLILAACITLGMALTVSAVVTVVIVGKTGALKLFPEQKARWIEITIGLISGAAIMLFGLVFLAAAIR